MDTPRSKNNSEKEKQGATSRVPKQALIKYGGWALGALMTLMLIGMLFGQHFSGFLNSIGFGWLYHESSGVYADCSKPSNRNNAYCIRQRGGDNGWRDLKDTKGDRTGFSLH